MKKIVKIINGWAIPKMIFNDMILQFKKNSFDVEVLDLPLLKCDQKTWKDLVIQIDKSISDQLVFLIGWSFGGVLSTVYASFFPKKVIGVVTLASNPCFVKKKEWEIGVSKLFFKNFCNRFSVNKYTAFKKFIQICIHDNKRRNNNLFDVLMKQIEIDLLDYRGLMNTLYFFGKNEAIFAYDQMSCKVLHCFGTNDALTPFDLSKKIVYDYSHHEVAYFEGSHCFFYNNPNVGNKIKEFICHHNDVKSDTRI